MKSTAFSGTSGPLMCWDIFMDAHNRQMEMLDSLQVLNKISAQEDWKMEWNLEKELLIKKKVILLTSTSQLIKFASPNIMAMNGYAPQEVMGKKPKMFQGEKTQDDMRGKIREAIIKCIPFKGSIINYRKNGSLYNCYVEEYPVWNKGGELINFIAFENLAA